MEEAVRKTLYQENNNYCENRLIFIKISRKLIAFFRNDSYNFFKISILIPIIYCKDSSFSV